MTISIYRLLQYCKISSITALLGLSMAVAQDKQQAPSAGSLVSGYSQDARSQMFKAPSDSLLTKLLHDTSSLKPGLFPVVGERAQALLKRIIRINSSNVAYDSYIWGTGSAKKTSVNPLDFIDLNNVIKPDVYTLDQSQQAQAVIEALANNLEPIEAVDLGDKANRFQNRQTQSYLAAFRSYSAIQIIGLNNLYQFYAERLPIDLKKLPGNSGSLLKQYPKIKDIYYRNLKDEDIKLSHVMLDKIMATRRLLDPDWHAALQQEDPTTLLRQIAILLAEQLAETYKLRMDIKDLQATMSVALLQTNATLRTVVESAASKLRDDSKVTT